MTDLLLILSFACLLATAAYLAAGQWLWAAMAAAGVVGGLVTLGHR